MILRTTSGVPLAGRFYELEGGKRVATTLLFRHEGAAERDDPLVRTLLGSGRAVLSVDLRATGRGKPETPAIAGAGDHNEAEWGLWVGRPLLGQWVEDAGRLGPLPRPTSGWPTDS